MKFEDIFNGNYVIKTLKDLKHLIYDVTFEPHNFSKDDFLNLIALFENKTIGLKELSYALNLVFNTTYYTTFTDEDLSLAMDRFNSEFFHPCDFNKILSLDEVEEIKKLFINVGVPFKDKTLSDDDLLKYVHKYIEEKEENLTLDIIDNLRHALNVLLEHKNPEGVFTFGRLMYGDGVRLGYKQDFNKALECYLFAGEHQIYQGYVNAGYIYYYDHLGTGSPDYEKAYHYFLKAYVCDHNNWNATYKLSDMYRYGLYVKKDLMAAYSLMESIYYDATYYVKKYPFTDDVPLAEIVMRYYELSDELKMTINAETDKNLLRGYYYQRQKINNHDYYGAQSVLKHIKELILKQLGGFDYDKEFKGYKDHYIKNQVYTVKDDKTDFAFRGIFIGEVKETGEDVCLNITHYRFRIDHILYLGEYKEDASYFDVNFLNIDQVSVIQFEPYNFVDEDEDYHSIGSDEDLENLNDLLKQDEYRIHKIKLGRFFEKYKFFKEVNIQLKGKNNKEILSLRAIFVSVISFNGNNEGDAISIELFNDGEFIISEIDNSNFIIKCASLSIKDDKRLNKTIKA